MKIIAHRGNDEVHKENSLEAILNSLSKSYIDGIEIDIRMTKDYNFIIHHNPFFVGYYIKKTKIKKLQKKGLNSLEEVLKQIKSDKIIMIEIKEESDKYKLLLLRLNKILKKYPLSYYLCSFNYNLIKYLKNKYSQYKAGLIIGYKINENYLHNNFDFSSVNYKLTPIKTNKETFIWTVNKKELLNKIADNQNIMTDKAKEISKFINVEKLL